MPPYRLNPYERSTLQNIAQYADSGIDGGMLFSLLQGTVEGAMARRQENIARQRELMSGLQSQAMQLATSGASEDAISAALMGQAGPLNDRREGRLMDFVGGLYDDGPVSGLAPADYRAQFATATGVDEEDRAAIGSIVVQGVNEGTPFRDIVDLVRQQAVATGQDELMTQALVGEAETAYERLIGGSMESARNLETRLWNTLNEQGIDPGDLQEGHLAEATGLDASAFEGYESPTVEGFVAQAVNDPELFRRLLESELYGPEVNAFTSNRPVFGGERPTTFPAMRPWER